MSLKSTTKLYDFYVPLNVKLHLIWQWGKLQIMSYRRLQKRETADMYAYAAKQIHIISKMFFY